MRFMQITFKYECVQVLFQDLPALVKDLDGCKGYRSLKRKEKLFLSAPDIDLICNIVCKGHLFAVVLMISQFSCLECNTFTNHYYYFLPVLGVFKKRSNSLSYSVLTLYKVVTSRRNTFWF